MKKVVCLLLSAVMVFAFSACGSKNENGKNMTIRMATTTSVNDSGLLPYLLEVFREKTGYTVEVQSAGTGAAIQKAKDGNADLILVHSKTAEEEFISQGYGVERFPFMFNYFIFVGPKEDKANIKNCKSAREALLRLAETQTSFVSRGDDSGTHKKEVVLWGDELPDPQTDKWYISAGQGMGATLTMASEQGAYCMTDKGTYLSMKDKLELEIILGESEDMLNTYSLIACNPDKIDDLNTEGTNTLIEWMLSDEASELIEKFGVEEYGQPLFYLIKD